MTAKQGKKAKPRRNSLAVRSFQPVLRDEAVAEAETCTKTVKAEVLEEEASADVEADNAGCVEAFTAKSLHSFFGRDRP